MKLEKNKIVFGGLILCVLLFIGAYGIMLIEKEEPVLIEVNQIPVPELEMEQKQYESKLEAINDLKEVKQTNAPSIYDERFLDSIGVFNPDLPETEKLEIIDSIYKNSKIYYSDQKQVNPVPDSLNSVTSEVAEGVENMKSDYKVAVKKLGLEHQLFFASNPEEIKGSNALVYVAAIVDGTQTVKPNYRIRMRLLNETEINGRMFDKNTPVYGIVNFKPNRTLININYINHFPVKLKAYDWQDGEEGIYVRNGFRAEATTEVIGDLVEDINIAGVPQLEGVKKIFQRNNRSIKVSVLGNYKLYLKEF
ncbi:conjugative transposon protein TraM [Formosa sp. S-31]|uniref:conjugative transposon protein TraM n=1 Tax=Formosa sp. S-31 TaxID=2790949 RepID=UPI003EB6B6CC